VATPWVISNAVRLKFLSITPAVFENYQAVQAIDAWRGEADTEELRKAVVHYGVLFDDMLEVRLAGPEILLAKEVELHA